MSSPLASSVNERVFISTMRNDHEPVKLITGGAHVRNSRLGEKRLLRGRSRAKDRRTSKLALANR